MAATWLLGRAVALGGALHNEEADYMGDAGSDLPPHVAETVQAIAKLQAEHRRKATVFERIVDRATAAIGRPVFLFALIAAVAAWMATNVVAGPYGAPDPPPFGWLELGLTALALIVTVLILTSQRRADRLADLREQMTLETTLLTEQKTRKIIELLEELRRDHPEIRNRIDAEALQMASKADPHEVLSVIEESTEQASRSIEESGESTSNNR